MDIVINKINWFPGHMKKATDEINKIIKTIDVILEVVDARAIKSSSNPDFAHLFNNKLHLKVALKSDLSTLKPGIYDNLIIANIYDKSLRKNIINKINLLLIDKINKYKAKGLVNPKFSILVCGLPNVGKSSLINLLRQKNVLVAQNTPGVTKTQKRVSITNTLDLIDSPGIFIKNIDSFETAYKLAIINCININVLNIEDVLCYAFTYLNQYYHDSLLKFYKINEYINFNQFINVLKPNFLSKNNTIDYNKLYVKLYKDVSESKICKINLD